MRSAESVGIVGVVGAGTMGAGIAQVAAAAGHEVYLVDAFAGAADAALARITAGLQRRVAKGALSADEAAGISARLHAASVAEDLPECVLVVEAIREDLSDKAALFAVLADHQPSDTILASNTSSLDIRAIAASVVHPERVLGLHFFNPPPAMKLVEVIHGTGTGPAYLAHAGTLMQAWGKVPVRCASTPGFIVNRVARPFYGEAQRMAEAGVADPATIDECLREGGFPMGPLELTDLIGQDVNLAVGTSVWEQTGHDPRYAPTSFQEHLVASGHLGRKTGQGVYRYSAEGRALGADPDVDLVQELLNGPLATNPLTRTLAMLVNEAVDLVDRGEASQGDVDTAMRLGTRYPRGPIEWGREIGFDVVAQQITELDVLFPGGRYRPSPGLHTPA